MANYVYTDISATNSAFETYKNACVDYDRILAKAIYEPKYTTSCYSSITIQEDVKPEYKGEEEWVWVTGYKGTKKDMTCRGYQFELGKQFDMPEDAPIKMCSSGFHFCDKIKSVFNYYSVKEGNRFFEVKALVRRWKKDGYYMTEQSNDKMVAKSIIFTRELTIDEIFDNINDYRISKDWTTEQKELARQTSVADVCRSIEIKDLTDLGYSEAFAVFARDKGAYEIARTMAKIPDVSMDVKVLTVCMSIYN